jgi:hypothetical protein
VLACCLSPLFVLFVSSLRFSKAILVVIDAAVAT